MTKNKYMQDFIDVESKSFGEKYSKELLKHYYKKHKNESLPELIAVRDAIVSSSQGSMPTCEQTSELMVVRSLANYVINKVKYEKG